MLVSAVLLVLTLASCFHPNEFYLEIFGDQECVGAEVLVDSQVIGEMSRVEGIGDEPDGAHLGALLRKGAHEIELRKPGFVSAVQRIDVPSDSEHYLHFTMRRLDAVPREIPH
jgi:hypothetical protein